MNEKEVEERFEHAANTLRKLRNLTNRDVPQSVKAAWPDIIHSYYEAYGWSEARYNRERPSAKDITLLDEVIDWSMRVPESDRRILWERAFGVKWAAIQKRKRCSRTTAWRDWCAAIIKVSMITSRCVFKQTTHKMLNI